MGKDKHGKEKVDGIKSVPLFVVSSQVNCGLSALVYAERRNMRLLLYAYNSCCSRKQFRRL